MRKFFADDRILYIENPKDSTKKLLELIHEFSKVAGYKINAQKSVAFLYTDNEAAEIEIKELIPFTTAPKIIKYLKKEVKNLYTENYRKLTEEIEDTQKIGYTFHAHELEEQILLKCQSYKGRLGGAVG